MAGKVVKQKALELLQRRIEELDSLPSKINKNDDSSEFSKWKINTIATIQNIFFDTKYLDFGKIRYIKMSLNYVPELEEIKAYNDGLKKARGFLESYIKEIEEFWEDTKKVSLKLKNEQFISKQPKKEIKSKSNDIFIVHGHDDGLVAKIQLFLKKIGLNGVVLHEQANLGKVILEKLEYYTNVDFAIILYTPCDLGKAKNDEEWKSRARQNVVFEHGYLMGKLGRENVVFLIDGNIETPGDISGAVYSSLSNHWQFDILKELKAVGYDVNANDLY